MILIRTTLFRGGGSKLDDRGKIIEEFIDIKNLNILNNGDNTHFSLGYKTFSAIDLTLVTPSLELYFDWYVNEDLHGSDHFPLIIPVIKDQMNKMRDRKWIIKKANWELYQENLNFTNLNLENVNDQDLYITNTIINQQNQAFH